MVADRRDEAGPVDAILDETALGMAQAKLVVDVFEGHGSLPLLWLVTECTETGWTKREDGRLHSNKRPPDG
ncbi:hypothetical protein GCM10023069_59070 [Shinella granuli]